MKFALLILLLVASTRSPLIACSCGERPPVSVALAKASAVFAGQCTAGQLITEQSGFQYRQFTFSITRSWKGTSEKKEIVVETALGGGDCGYDFQVGSEYIVYCDEDKGIVRTHICTRTRIKDFEPESESEMTQLTDAARQPTSTP